MLGQLLQGLHETKEACRSSITARAKLGSSAGASHKKSCWLTTTTLPSNPYLQIPFNINKVSPWETLPHPVFHPSNTSIVAQRNDSWEHGLWLASSPNWSLLLVMALWQSVLACQRHWLHDVETSMCWRWFWCVEIEQIEPLLVLLTISTLGLYWVQVVNYNGSVNPACEFSFDWVFWACNPSF